MTKASHEKKHPTITLTNTALEKAASLCPAVAVMSRADRIQWLRDALAWGEDIPRERLHPDIKGRALVLPAEFMTDLGDRLVAICIIDAHDASIHVATTMKPQRACMVDTRRAMDSRSPAPLSAPLVPEEKRAALSLVVTTAKGESVKLVPEVKPAPPVDVVDEEGEDDNRGAMLARMELAKRRCEHGSVAKAVGLTAPQFSKLINGHIEPTIKVAVAMRDALGVPVEAWTEAL